MKSAMVCLCLGLLVVAGPLQASAQNAAAGISGADAQGDEATAVTFTDALATAPFADVVTGSIAENDDVAADALAGATTVGDNGVAVAATGAAVVDDNAQAASLSGSANFDGAPTVAEAGAFSNADGEGAFAQTTTDAFTDPTTSGSFSASLALAPSADDDDASVAFGGSLAVATGPSAQSGALTVADAGDNQATSGSAGFAVSGRKLRFN